MKKIILLTMLLMSAQFADTQVMNRILAGQNIIQLINSNNYLYCLPSPDNRVFPASFDVLRLKTYNITGFNDTVLSIGNIHYQPIGNYYSTPTGSTSEYIRGDGSRATFPTIPASPVNADWNAPSGLAMIQNKPTVLSAFTNDANYISQSAGDIRYAMLSDTFPVGNIMTTRGANNAINGLTTAVNGKQPTLVSGTNIKTVNGNSLLGSGNLVIPTGTTYTAGTGIGITGSTISNTAPDQTVTLTAGKGITITGTYPNFTIAMVAPTITVRNTANGNARSLNSNFTVDATKESLVTYSVTCSVTNPLIVGTSSATAFLEYSTNGGTTWQTPSQNGNSSGVGITVTIQLTNGQTGTLVGTIPANALTRIRTVTAGTATVTYVTGQETVY